MEKLLVSGLVYTPIGDPNPKHAELLHTKRNFNKQKFPIDIVEQFERFSVGQITQMKQIWIDHEGKKVPVYYALGYVSHKPTISQILESAKGNVNDYHSWCAVFNHYNYLEYINGNWEQNNQDGYSGEWDNFEKAFVCCTPCLTYSHLFIPYADKKMNDTLIEKHFAANHSYLPSKLKRTFKKIKMDHDLFWNLFGDKFSKKEYINFRKLKNYPDHRNDD